MALHSSSAGYALIAHAPSTVRPTSVSACDASSCISAGGLPAKPMSIQCSYLCSSCNLNTGLGSTLYALLVQCVSALAERTCPTARLASYSTNVLGAARRGSIAIGRRFVALQKWHASHTHTPPQDFAEPPKRSGATTLVRCGYLSRVRPPLLRPYSPFLLRHVLLSAPITSPSPLRSCHTAY